MKKRMDRWKKQEVVDFLNSSGWGGVEQHSVAVRVFESPQPKGSGFQPQVNPHCVQPFSFLKAYVFLPFHRFLPPNRPTDRPESPRLSVLLHPDAGSGLLRPLPHRRAHQPPVVRHEHGGPLHHRQPVGWTESGGPGSGRGQHDGKSLLAEGPL